MKTLMDLRPSEKGIVAKIDSEGFLRQRIMEMGITEGEEIELVKVAPLGDPVELSLRGYRLSLRKADALRVIVKS